MGHSGIGREQREESLSDWGWPLGGGMSGGLCASVSFSECVHVCIYEHVCVHLGVSGCIFVWVSVYLCVSVFVCLYVCVCSVGNLGGLERRSGKGRNVRSLGRPRLDKPPNPEEEDLILGSFLMKGPHLFYCPLHGQCQRGLLWSSLHGS